MQSPLGEFELIQRFFKTGSELALSSHEHVITLGIGDDCALLKPKPGEVIAITSDMLVEGRHFFENANPECLGHKALAVNLSDLAAMGASPLGFTLCRADYVRGLGIDPMEKPLNDQEQLLATMFGSQV